MAESQTTTKDKEEQKEPRFPRYRVVAESDVLLGETRRHIVAGAISDLKGTGDITLAEARKAVDTYRKREVKEAGE